MMKDKLKYKDSRKISDKKYALKNKERIREKINKNK